MMTTSNKRLAGILIVIPLLLLIPFVAMQYTTEVHWTIFDFIIAGLLLLGAGLAIELILRMVSQRKHRIILGITVFVVLFLLWAELAVGIFGTPFAGS